MHPFKHKCNGGQATAKSRYADGGKVDESETFTSERDRRGNVAMDALPPRAGSGFTEERDALGNKAMTSLPPRAFKTKD